ncbi:hypothetical protein A3800_31205 [Streptomyces badius]|nr:hypothetical protein A3800_31205 [Streptomyces badius]
MRSSPAASAATLRTAPTSHRAVCSPAPSIQGRGGAHEPFRGERLDCLERVEQDQGHGLREPGGQLGPVTAHQVGAEEGQDDARGAFGLSVGLVLAAFPDPVQERFPSQGHRSRLPGGAGGGRGGGERRRGFRPGPRRCRGPRVSP